MKMLYVHSKCCHAHWELLWYPAKQRYQLVCEECGKPLGVKVTGGDLGSTCDKCGEKMES